MKKLKWMALIAFECSLSSCDKSKVEEPKVENSIEATFLGEGCGQAFFSITDTTKVKGTFRETSWFSGTLFGLPDMIEKKLPPPFRVFVGMGGNDSKINNIKLKIDKKYNFEFRKIKPLEGIETEVFTGKCFPSAIYFEQIVLLDTLTTKFTKYK